MWRCVLTTLLLLTACAPEATEPLNVREGCNPLGAGMTGDADCLLPYPSDVYRVKDGASDAYRLDYPDAALPHDKNGNTVSPVRLRPATGFSAGTQILASFPEGIDPTNLVGAPSDPAESLEDSSPTLLVDDAGHRVMHIAELDPRAKTEDRRALVIRPLERLRSGARYIVAIRGLRGMTGEQLPPREGFRRLRDGELEGETALAALGDFDARVLGPLEAFGVARSELQLAWDFTVREDDDPTRDLRNIRELVLAAPPPKVTVVSSKAGTDKHTGRKVELELEVPLYLETIAPFARLHRDAAGNVTANGVAKVPVTLWIPKSVADAQAGAPPARLMQFGHGFFGNRHEVDDFAIELADERGFVIVAADWWGMTDADKVPLAGALAGDVGAALVFCDRVHQAFANQLMLARAAEALAALPETQRAATPTFDPKEVYFYGISMGSILGGIYLGLSPIVRRGVLSVGGADWSMMMFRARPFLGFLAFVQIALPDALDQQKFAAFAQLEMDRIDPLTYAPLLAATPLPESPKDRRVMMQVGIGDAAVPNLASHLYARALGAALLAPAPRPIAGLEEVSGPYDGNALVEFDFGIDPLPSRTAQPSLDDTPAHEGVRRAKAGQEQLDRFFRPGGTIEATCDGPCNPN